MDWFSLSVMLVAGLGAGAVMGLIGASAIILLFPIFVLVLKMDSYTAIGLSLAIDVFAAIIASRVYYKKGHIDLRGLLYFLIFAFVGVVLGSYFSLFISSGNLSGLIGIAIIGVGIAFIANKSHEPRPFLKRLRVKFQKRKVFWLCLLGFLIGITSGIFGAGGGVTILFVLVFILGYEMHIAIGTSVFIMMLISLCGSVFHYYHSPFSWIFLIVGSVGAILGANFSSVLANKISEEKLKKLAGFILIILGMILITKIFVL